MSVGMPANLKLELFGSIVRHVFGHFPFLVGSALSEKVWRDVDVRVILPDEEYESWMLPSSGVNSKQKWSALCMAFSSLGREMTGLPIDFQIQQQTKANAMFPGPRSAIGTTYAARNLGESTVPLA